MQSNLSNAIPYFEEAVKQTDKVFFAFDIDNNHFIYLNQAFEKLFQRPVDLVFSNPTSLLEMFFPEDKEYIICTYYELIQGVKKKDREFRIQLPDGSLRWTNITPCLVEANTGGRAIVGFAEDISKKKDKESYVQEFAAKKNAVLEILSHDLAAPLNNIKGLTFLMTKELNGQSNTQLEKLIKMVEVTSDRAVQLIREFVKQEFLQSKESALIKERVNIVEKIIEIIEQYKASANEISKIFHFNASGEPIFIRIDSNKFSQVVNNLISNAIKFTKDNGEITVGLENKKDTVLVTIADNGIGIPTKYHDTLFEKFTKARRPGLRGEPSVGLGMSIIKTIVEWHGGKIWFKSEESVGSTFYIELPKE